MSSISSHDLRRAFDRLSIGAAVITAYDGPRPHGSTGMAWGEGGDGFLLTTLSSDGRTLPIVRASGRFGVNVLSVAQAPLVATFARSAIDRFAGVGLAGITAAVPILEHAVVAFECAVLAMHPFGSHEIVVGEVVRLVLPPDAPDDPVVYHRGRLWRLAEIGA